MYIDINFFNNHMKNRNFLLVEDKIVLLTRVFLHCHQLWGTKECLSPTLHYMLD